HLLRHTTLNRWCAVKFLGVLDLEYARAILNPYELCGYSEASAYSPDAAFKHCVGTERATCLDRILTGFSILHRSGERPDCDLFKPCEGCDRFVRDCRSQIFIVRLRTDRLERKHGNGLRFD